MNLLEKFNKNQLEKLSSNKKNLNFSRGDTVKVSIKIATSGSTGRIQAFEGVVIRRRNKGIESSFLVRKIGSGGLGIEKDFKLFSPLIHNIETIRRGKVRSAKIYYLRKLTGKAARIKEKIDPNATKKSAQKQ